MFFFCVELCYILWSVLLHHWICVAPLVLCCAIGELIAPMQLYCAIVSRYNLSFKWSGKVVFFNLFLPFLFLFLRSRCIHSSSRYDLSFKWWRDEERLWRIWRWFVIWCGEFVWQWRKFKREMWRSCFRKTLCGLKRNKGCWLNARRTKRIRLVGEVGWSIGECRFIFTMPVAGCRRIEFISSATSC